MGARGTEWSEGTPLTGYFITEVSSVNWKVILARKARKAGKARKAILSRFSRLSSLSRKLSDTPVIFQLPVAALTNEYAGKVPHTD